MRFALAGGLLVAALAAGAPAAAADMPLKAPPVPYVSATWTGTYIGINGGYAWGTTSHTDIFGFSTQNFSQSGGMAGITYGGNWQSGRWVLGFESDLDWANINGTFTSAALCSVNGGSTCFTKIKAFSTERMRAGYDLQGWLLYATGGVAFARVNAGQNPCGPVPVNVRLGLGGGNSCNEEWRTGWVAGVGVEKMFLPHWSAKIEYLHYDLGNAIQYMPTAILGGSDVRVLERGDIVRVGINYQFDFLSLLPIH